MTIDVKKRLLRTASSFKKMARREDGTLEHHKRDLLPPESTTRTSGRLVVGVMA